MLAGIDEELAGLKSNQQAGEPTSPEAQNDLAVLVIESVPSGADVELDGKFVGNTPTTLCLKPGTYSLSVKKEGFITWTRHATAISGNEQRIAAELDKTQ